MFRLSRKTLFAIEAVLDIAYNAGAVPVQSREITRRQGIPRRYLEQVLQNLVRAGVLSGVRGAPRRLPAGARTPTHYRRRSGPRHPRNGNAHRPGRRNRHLDPRRRHRRAHVGRRFATMHAASRWHYHSRFVQSGARHRDRERRRKTSRLHDLTGRKDIEL